MSETFEDYEREYNAYLSRIRSFLAGTRSRATLQECERLLQQARVCACAMQELASNGVEGQDAMRIRQAQQLLERDIAPLTKEVQRALNEMELFYQPPDIELGGSSTDMDSLLQNSEHLLRESQSILAETEQIGTSTLHQMGRQREQLQNTNSNLAALQDATSQARILLSSMSRKALKNKLCLYVLIVILTTANGYVLYKIYKKHSK